MTIRFSYSLYWEHDLMAQTLELFWWRCWVAVRAGLGRRHVVSAVLPGWRGRHWYWRLCPRGPHCPGWCRASAPPRWWCGTRAPPSIAVVVIIRLSIGVTTNLMVNRISFRHCVNHNVFNNNKLCSLHYCVCHNIATISGKIKTQTVSFHNRMWSKHITNKE